MGPTLTAAAMSFLLLAGTLAGWLSLDRAVNASAGVTVMILMNIVVMLVALGIETSRRPYSLHLMHLLSLFLFVGASALLQYSSGTFGVAGPISLVRDQIIAAVVAVTLWLLGYLSAYEGQRALVAGPQGPMVRFLERPLTVSRTRFVLVLAVISLLYLTATGVAGAATRGAVLESMREYANQSGAGEYTSVWYMLNLLLLRAFSLVALLAALLVYFRDRSSRSGPFTALVIIAAVGVLVVNNPFAAARMWLAITVIAFLAPFFLRRRQTGTMLVLIALGGIAFLPALNMSRYSLELTEWWQYFQLASPIEYLSTSSDVDSLGMLALCYQWVQIFGHSYGMQMLGAALFWVPRAIWPTKPIETGGMVTAELGFDFTNLAPPIMSDPLVDFGFVGVPIVGALFGLLLGRLDMTYWHGRERPEASRRVIDYIYPFWLGCVIFLTRGGLFASLGWTTCFTVWIVFYAVGVRRPPAMSGAHRAEGSA